MKENIKVLNQYIDNKFSVYNGDNISCIDGLPDESIGLVVSSPPFARMYTYSNTPRDIGNSDNIDELVQHFRFLIGKDKLRRVIKPGRSVCIHLTQTPVFASQDGYVGRLDFRGDIIRLFQSEGWIYSSEVLVEKCPQLKAQRTKDRGLLFKTLANDASYMAPCMADYILIFRDPRPSKDPIKAGKSTKYNNPNGWVSAEEWIEWAAPVWRRRTSETPDGIRDTNTLNVTIARDGDDELHLCPLSLDICERCIKLWSNPDDIIMDFFSGVGSVGYKAIELGRKYTGFELKESYFKTSIKYLKEAQEKSKQPSLFDMFGTKEPEETEDEL